MTEDAQLRDISDIAPSGTLRVAINLGNSVLAQPGADPAQPRGITPKLAAEFAQRLGLPVRFVVYQAAGHVFATAESGQWDLAFLAQDPKRAEKVSFSTPYLVLEGSYLVRDTVRFRTIDDLDQEGVRIAVTEGAAYDLHLTRTLTHASLVRGSAPPAAFALFDEGNADAVAGVRQILLDHAAHSSEAVVLPGSFSAIAQAMCVPIGRSRALALIERFISDLGKTTFVRDALTSNGLASTGDGPAATPV